MGRLNPVHDEAGAPSRVEDPNDVKSRLVTAKNERETARGEIGQAKKRGERVVHDAQRALDRTVEQRSDLTERRSVIPAHSRYRRTELGLEPSRSPNLASDSPCS